MDKTSLRISYAILLFFLHIDSIQFNSKTLFKDGVPVSLLLIFPGAIPTMNMLTNTTFFHTYIQNNTGSSEKQRQTQHTLILNVYNVYTNMYIHHTLTIYE